LRGIPDLAIGYAVFCNLKGGLAGIPRSSPQDFPERVPTKLYFFGVIRAKRWGEIMLYAAGGILLLLIIFVYAVFETRLELRRDKQKSRTTSP
jgi:hypothetical protein